MRWGVALAIGAVLATACSALGLDESAPPDPTVTTSAAAVADTTSAGSAVTIPTLVTGTTSTRAAPTPWRSRTSTSATSTTTSQPPQTAPTTTRLTLTFDSGPAVTNPTIAAPTSVASPPPSCYSKGTCPVADSASSAGGTVKVVSIPDHGGIAAITKGANGATSVTLPWAASPRIACSGSYCLVQGSNFNLFFGHLIRINAGALSSIPGTISSPSRMHLISSSPAVVAGTYRFNTYGLGPTDSPTSSRTWAISGGTLTSTGCGEPYLYATPPAAATVQRGACSGTPRVHGYSESSGNTMTHLGGFVTPSGNIHCGMTLDGEKVACTEQHHAFSVASCSTDASKGLRVILRKTGRTTYDDCLGYTLVGTPKTNITYRRLAVGHGFVCEVRKSGVTCTAPTGNGFTLSRSAIKTF